MKEAVWNLSASHWIPIFISSPILLWAYCSAVTSFMFTIQDQVELNLFLLQQNALSGTFSEDVGGII